MKSKVLNILANLPFEVIAYTMESEKCSTLCQLVDKLSYSYTKDDAERIGPDLMYAYECGKK